MITSEAALRQVYGQAEGLAVDKVRPRLDKHSRQYIALSPFLVLSTANAQGKADVTPRGDPPGFVKVIDERTILIPDRPGNNRLDAMGNILQNPNVACLFFIPGFEDTLRLNGRARIVNDAQQLSRCLVNGKAPKAGILITIDEVFLHCAKALKRSKLWQEDYRQDRRQMPSIARIIMEQVCETEIDEKAAAEADASVEENYRAEMY